MSFGIRYLLVIWLCSLPKRYKVRSWFLVGPWVTFPQSSGEDHVFGETLLWPTGHWMIWIPWTSLPLVLPLAALRTMLAPLFLRNSSCLFSPRLFLLPGMSSISPQLAFFFFFFSQLSMGLYSNVTVAVKHLLAILSKNVRWTFLTFYSFLKIEVCFTCHKMHRS